MMMALILIAAVIFFAGAGAGPYGYWPRRPHWPALAGTWTRSIGGRVVRRRLSDLVLEALDAIGGASPGRRGSVANPFALRSALSLSRRMAMWIPTPTRRIAGYWLEIVKAHPWLGIGPEQVSRQYRNYLPPGMTVRAGRILRPLENDYIQYAAERGVPTMLALMWMIGWALRDFARALRRLPAGAGAMVAHGAVAVTIGVLVSGCTPESQQQRRAGDPYGCVRRRYVAIMPRKTRAFPAHRM